MAAVRAPETLKHKVILKFLCWRSDGQKTTLTLKCKYEPNYKNAGTLIYGASVSLEKKKHSKNCCCTRCGHLIIGAVLQVRVSVRATDRLLNISSYFTNRHEVQVFSCISQNASVSLYRLFFSPCRLKLKQHGFFFS